MLVRNVVYRNASELGSMIRQSGRGGNGRKAWKEPVLDRYDEDIEV